MNTALERIVFVVLVLAVGGGIWWWWKSREAPPPPPVAAPVVEPAAVKPAEPQIQHPIEKAPVAEQAEAPKPLPPLAESDPTVLDALASLFAQRRLPEFLITKDLVRRIVATVDNLPRAKASLQLWPVKPAPGKFIVDGAGGTQVIGADNAARYAPYVQWVEAIDARKLAAVYVRLYPLFQQAYRDLGYPQGYFNDRLVTVIDHLLATPEPKAPLALTQPKVLYEYADADLQALSAGQKVLLRIGVENAAKVKAKLRELRREITRNPPA